MPHVTIQLLPGRTVEQKRKAAKGITDAIVEHLRANPESVTIVFQEVSRENMAKAGTLFSDQQH